MRIGIDARMYRSGVAGISRYSKNLISNLLKIDFENHYVLFMTSEDEKEFKNLNPPAGGENSLKIENLKFKIVTIDIPHYSLKEQTEFLKILEKEKLDLVHFLNFNHPVRYKGRYLVTIHDLTLLLYPETARETNFIKKLAFRYTLKNACQKAVKIIAVSRNTKSDINRILKVPKEKIEVIYEAVDDQILDKASLKIKTKIIHQYHLDKPVILTVGQFRPHKNLVNLVKAFGLLRKKIPCTLVILGKGDLQHTLLYKTVDKQDLKDDIIMPGYVLDEELAAWYEIASVFVFPSLYEGFGLPGLEAMASKIAVVASNKSALPEIYQDGALYFDPFLAGDIADKIKTVLENKKIQAELIQNGQKVLQNYSWQKTAQETLKIYHQLEK